MLFHWLELDVTNVSRICISTGLGSPMSLAWANNVGRICIATGLLAWVLLF